MNPRRVALGLLVVGCAVSALSAQGRRLAAPEGLRPQSWKVDGVERTALIAGPKAGAPKPPAPPPVVLVFHGHGGTSAQAARSFRIHEAWPDAVVLYPQGLATVGQITDPQGRLPGWQHVPGGENDRDLKFVDAMLAWIAETHGLNPKRTFAAGHSNGGSMVYTLWAARGDRFAAVAPSSSIFRPDVSARAKPKPVFIVAGKQDALVPFAAQQRSLRTVRDLNQASGAEVATYIHEGGHQLPSDAGARMVGFFKSLENLRFD